MIIGVMLRATGSTIALSPILTFSKSNIDQMIDTLSIAIKESAEKMSIQ